VFDCPQPLPPLVELGDRHAEFHAFVSEHRNHDDARRVGVGQRAEEDTAGDGKYRRVDARAEGEDEDGGTGCPSGRDQRPDGDSEIVQKSVHHALFDATRLGMAALSAPADQSRPGRIRFVRRQ